jgi:acyl CoA:acetate/3-ketoacid CoA transferase beta subunit
MSHCTREGEPKLLQECTYPLTAVGVVDRVITDLAVLDITEAGFVLVECAPGVTPAQVVAATGAPVQT